MSAPLFGALLRTLADGGSSLPEGTPASPREVAVLVGAGLGPLLHRLRPDGGWGGGPAEDATLHGADLTARVLTHELLDGVEDTLRRLHAGGTRPILIKGIAMALRYYAEPHLRSMGDVDLLVAGGPSGAAAASRILLERGFEPDPDPPPEHHHAPALHHPERELWVEIHHALLPPGSPARDDPPFDAGTVDDAVGSWELRGVPVGTLPPERELALLAAGWCYDLGTRFGIPGTWRSPVDAVLLLRESGPALDWDRVLAWSRGRYTGACLAALLAFLEGHGAFRGPAEVPGALVRSQGHVGPVTLRALGALLDRYVSWARRPGTAREADVLGRMAGGLVGPRSAWRNVAGLPGRVLFGGSAPD